MAFAHNNANAKICKQASYMVIYGTSLKMHVNTVILLGYYVVMEFKTFVTI